MTETLPSILTQLHALPWTFNPPAAAAELEHLAVTLPALIFVSADKRQLAVAAAEALPIHEPV
jgi:hypothetical protein